jgi:Protein of unknown function (DUF3048) N-terminal domain/Protein of unknown function (DUF3048) C-terminal domain
MRRSVKTAAATLALVGVAAAGAITTGAVSVGTPAASPLPEPVALTQPSETPSLAPSPSPSDPVAIPSPTPTPTPTATPKPTPILVRAPLTGRLVSPSDAAQHPIALMIDDAPRARPQSGFNAASVVWQAPAEGGTPRYMMVFQDQMPKDVGPVRSARYYFITWAAEWNAVYGHVGGSPQAQATLRAKGNGQLVYNADQFRWGGTYYRRIGTRSAPHNVYSDAKSLRIMATKVGAKNTPLDEPLKAVWRFRPDAPLAERPSGGIIRVAYPLNKIEYRYDRATNTYLRGVTGQKKQIDAADGKQVAPKNVVIMMVSFGPLNDGSNKHRLEARNVGSGKAWIATNGRTIVGTWKKTSLAGPTRFYDKTGKAVTLTVGQTFIQVMPLGSSVSIKDGPLPKPVATPTPAPAATPAPSSSSASSPNASASPA